MCKQAQVFELAVPPLLKVLTQLGFVFGSLLRLLDPLILLVFRQVGAEVRHFARQPLVVTSVGELALGPEAALPKLWEKM